MGVLKKLVGVRKYETSANYGLGNSLSSSAVANVFGNGGDSINVLEEYNGFAWKCINIRAEALSDQDLYVERLVGNKWITDDNHDFNAVLEGGSGVNDQSELLEGHSKSMDLYGESFWYYSKTEGSNKPYAIYLLDPSAVTVLVADNKIRGYVYQKDGERLLLDLDEVDYFRIIDPTREKGFRGKGPMQAAGWFIKSGRYTQTYVNNFLDNNAIPAGVVVAKGQVDDADWKLFKEQWTAKYGGVANAGKTGFVRSTDLEFVKTGLSLGEVDFTKMKEASREDVMIMFGISKPMMAIFDDINRASAVTAQKLFAQTFTSPALRKLRRKISKNVAKWYGNQYRIGSTNPIPTDEEEKLAAYDKGIGRWFTVNEARAAYGLEPIKGGDELNTSLAASNSSLPTIGTGKTLGKLKIKTVTKKTGFSYEMKESFRSKTEEIQKKYELKFLQAANPVLTQQKNDVLDQISPKKVAESKFDVEVESQKLADALNDIMISLAVEQGSEALAIVAPSSEFKLTTVQEVYIKDSVAKATRSFTDETQELVANAVKEGLEAGESVVKIGKRIDAIYSDATGIKTPGYRIERLARTEVIKASNQITQVAYKESGVVQKKEWFTNPGACEFCNALDGSIIQLTSTFVSKGDTLEGTDGGTRVNTYENVEHPPAHPQCRCTILPVIED